MLRIKPNNIYSIEFIFNTTPKWNKIKVKIDKKNLKSCTSMSKDELGRSPEAEAEDLQLEAGLGHIASSWLKTNKQTNRITNKTAYR